METTIYLDVLFLLNFFVTWMLFMATKKLLNTACSKWRLLAGSLLGGIYSLLILLTLSPWELTLIKLAMGLSLVFAVFWRRRQGWFFWKLCLCFFLVNFIFAGFMTALWLFVAPAGMQFANGVVYFDISALTLALATAAAYLVLSLFSAVFNRRNRKGEEQELILSLEGRQVSLRGFADTGNKLCDIFTGLPVVICEYDAVAGLFSDRIKAFFADPLSFSFAGMEGSRYATQLRMIPVNGVNGEGSLPAFKPDEIQIGEKSVQAIVAVTCRRLSDGSFQGIFNPGAFDW